jgi:2-polyprenyl-3-methyl-5-hydroxy-6-metoxy-1,4-benzoquinol methylase
VSKIANLFDTRSTLYDGIYANQVTNNLMHQEKQIRARITRDLILENFDDKSGGTILDVGCGSGKLLLDLEKSGISSKMLGIDISPDMVNLANSKKRVNGSSTITFKEVTIEDLTATFSLLTCLGVLGYQSDQKAFLAKLCERVDNQGTIIFSTANGDSFTRKLRRVLSKSHTFLTNKKKSSGIEFCSMKHCDVEKIMTEQGFVLQRRIFITFGLGLVNSRFSCWFDRFLFVSFAEKLISRYLSLTVIYKFVRQ